MTTTILALMATTNGSLAKYLNETKEHILEATNTENNQQTLRSYCIYKLIIVQLVNKLPSFTEPERPFSLSREPATGLYPASMEFNHNGMPHIFMISVL
jgi:hypothetical protein